MSGKMDFEVFIVFVVGAVIANVLTIYLEKQLFPEDF